MSRSIKEMICGDLKKAYADLDSAMVVNVHKLSGTDVNTLRGLLKKQKVAMHVIKNRFAKRVLAGTALEPIGAVLTGPCAFVTGGSSSVDVAKQLVALVKEYPALELKSGIVDGDPELITIEAISKRRSKAELQGEVVMLAVSPGRRIAGCLNVGGKIADCVKAIVDKLEKGEAIAKVA
ncbi:MAG: 50S ribosomal protein L10 [Planctomycetes bacterium UTPLA1]|jgi:large subunit ribosomal protein L10|nr:MAG: 50S ribosomal protein L10 [Planctomycetes bacterium UTPLA1]